MVEPNTAGTPSTRRGTAGSPVPPAGRLLIRTGSVVTGLTGRLTLTGALPPALRRRPFLLAANHIGIFDTAVLLAACHRLGIAPRFVTNGGLFDTPLLGALLHSAGHLRVDPLAAGSVVRGTALQASLAAGGPVLIYPEGRVSRDPDLWPERGQTGVARLALATGLPVLPLSQWGAHQVIPCSTPPVRSLPAFGWLLASWLRSVRPWHRPTFRVHLGEPVDLAGLRHNRPGDAVRAHARIMRAITDGLVPLRAAEPDQLADPVPLLGDRSPWRPS